MRTTVYAATLALALALAPAVLTAAGDAAKGKEAFQACGVCHRADSTQRKIGPGLKGLFHKPKLANGKKPTAENVMAVINKGGHGMPPYQNILTQEKKEDLLAYLKTL